MQKSQQGDSARDPQASARRTRLGVAALLLAAALLFGLRLGALDLWAPDEPRYGAIAEELRSGRHGARGWVLLHVNDVPYTQKPPLYFWLAAGLGTLTGRVDEAVARWPSAVAGLASVGVAWLVGRRLLASPALALWAAAVLATSFRFAFSARRAQLDVLLCAFELAAIALFVGFEWREAGRDARPGLARVAALHAALGAAALVKGPVGWLPLLVMLAFLASEGRARTFRDWAPAWAWLLSLGPVSLWMAGAVAVAPAGFAEIAVTENLIGRFFAGTAHVRPFWYYARQAPLDFLPWALLWPWGLAALAVAWRAGPERRSERLIALWIAIPLLFFTLSAGKRGVYLLPIFPALAMMTALGLERLAKGRRGGVPRGAVIAVAAVFFLELALFQLVLPRLDPTKSPRPIAESIAAAARPGEATGVYGLEPIEAALRYYGSGPIVSLREEPALRAFLAAGGRLVLLRGRQLDGLAPALGLEAVARFRSGRRELGLARAAPRETSDAPLASAAPDGASTP